VGPEESQKTRGLNNGGRKPIGPTAGASQGTFGGMEGGVVGRIKKGRSFEAEKSREEVQKRGARLIGGSFSTCKPVRKRRGVSKRTLHSTSGAREKKKA